MHRGLACWLAGLLVVASVVAPAVATGTPDGPLGVGQEEFEPDNVTLSAAVEDDGSAAWSFKYRMELATENDTQAFESLAKDIEQNRSAYVDRFRSRIEATVASAENATGREMSVENVSVRAFQQPGGEFVDSYGFVEYTFEWNGFAAVEGQTIRAGDALEGFYLNNETALQFSWQDGYGVADVDPQPTQSSATSVRWDGPEDFGTNQPLLVLEPSQPTTTEATTAGGTSGATTTAAPPSEGGGGGILLPVLGGAAVAALVLGGAGYVYWRRERGEGGPTPAAGATGDGGDGGGDAGGAAAAGGGAAGDDEPPEELLSNEERVEKFLREQGGRAKQQAVVDAMGWTEAKTSQVVKEMRENDDIESFRIGRENVLKLPDADEYEEE